MCWHGGIIEEGKAIMEEADGASVLDAGLIVAAQKVEHYEIAAYGSARAHAEQLGYSDAADFQFQQREWRFERAGWAVMATFILAASAGLFGGAGFFNKTSAGNRNGAFWVE